MSKQGISVPLADANRRADALIRALKFQWPHMEIHIAGSIRREVAIVSDVDFILITPTGLMPVGFEEDLPFLKFTCLGKKKATGIAQDGMQYDFRSCTDEAFGAMQLHCTGSTEHNILMRKKAKSMSCSLSEYGLTIPGGGIICDKEINIFKALRMDYIEPKHR